MKFLSRLLGSQLGLQNTKLNHKTIGKPFRNFPERNSCYDLDDGTRFIGRPWKKIPKTGGLLENKSRLQISDHQRGPQDQFFKNPWKDFPAIHDPDGLGQTTWARWKKFPAGNLWKFLFHILKKFSRKTFEWDKILKLTFGKNILKTPASCPGIRV